MLTLCRSTVLGAAFLAGVAIAASADPLCCTPTGPCRPPGPQIATIPLANVTLANVAPVCRISIPTRAPTPNPSKGLDRRVTSLNGTQPADGRSQRDDSPGSLANSEACLGSRWTT